MSRAFDESDDDGMRPARRSKAPAVTVGMARRRSWRIAFTAVYRSQLLAGIQRRGGASSRARQNSWQPCFRPLALKQRPWFSVSSTGQTARVDLLFPSTLSKLCPTVVQQGRWRVRLRREGTSGATFVWRSPSPHAVRVRPQRRNSGHVGKPLRRSSRSN